MLESAAGSNALGAKKCPVQGTGQEDWVSRGCLIGADTAGIGQTSGSSGTRAAAGAAS